MARKEINVSQEDRTKLTIEFNKKVEQFCKEEGVSCLNLDSISIGDDGLVLKELKNSNPLDHHYDSNAHAKLIAVQLKRLK